MKSKASIPKKTGRGRKWLRRFAYLLVAIGLLLGGLMADGWSAMGSAARGARLDRIKRSPHFVDGKFVNMLTPKEPKFFPALWKWIKGAENTTPDGPLPIQKREAKELSALPSSGLRISWFGHSTLLIELDGRRFLVDPVWSERVSPFSYLGPKRFHPVPLELSALPKLDAVVISHDHYDHLDHATILALAKTPDLRFIVPLGVGAHLEGWGIAAARIVELDWWEKTTIGGIELVATPARHFSGRSVVMADRNKTLWAGWALRGPKHRVYYSGDTAMFPGFAEIGKRLGPFDAAMIEVGAYDQLWADVHLGPEQAVEALVALGNKAAVLFPVHWGTFNLALHAWTEPVERLLVAAKQAGIRVVTPRPGQSIEPSSPPPPKRWWPKITWQSAKECPIRSSGLE